MFKQFFGMVKRTFNQVQRVFQNPREAVLQVAEAALPTVEDSEGRKVGDTHNYGPFFHRRKAKKRRYGRWVTRAQ